jgi:hypothetical protein
MINAQTVEQGAPRLAPPTLAPPPLATEDPYYFAFKPSGGFEGGFRLKSAKDFDAFIHMLNGFKVMFATPTGAMADDDDLLG